MNDQARIKKFTELMQKGKEKKAASKCEVCGEPYKECTCEDEDDAPEKEAKPVTSTMMPTINIVLGLKTKK